MAILATGQPPPGVVQPPSNPSNLSPPLNPLQTVPQNQNTSYKSILNTNVTADVNIAIPAPTFDLHHGEPSFVWEDKVVDLMMRHEELHYAVIGKFSYGMPEFHELRKQIPLQCEIKGECSIGFLETRHVVIRLSLLEDYVHLLSRPAFSLKLGVDFYQMRTMKYEVWFDPRAETSIAVAWISFPGLPPAFFVKDAVFALASAVGKPLQLDAATKAKTRPSCAKVKVELDLLASRPQRFRIGIKNSSTGEIKYKWIRIRYDFLPKYCKVCRLQGHNEDECFSLHPELVSVEEVKAKEDHFSKKVMVQEAPLRVLKSGKTVGTVKEVPVQIQAPQGKSSTKYIHANRNPKAWTRVEHKTKQHTTDIDRIDQRQTVALVNAFATLDNGDDEPSTQPHNDVTLTQHDLADGAKEKSATALPKSKGLDESLEDGALLSPKSLQIGTTSWVRQVFKNHPKTDVVGVSVKSGTGLSRAAMNEDLGSQKGIKAGGVDLTEDEELSGLAAAREGHFSAIDSRRSVLLQRPIALDVEVEGRDEASRFSNVVEYRGEFRIKEQPSALMDGRMCGVDIVSQKTLHAVTVLENRGDLILPSPSLNACGNTINVGESCGVIENCADSLAHVEAPSAFQIDSSEHAFDASNAEGARGQFFIDGAEDMRILEAARKGECQFIPSPRNPQVPHVESKFNTHVPTLPLKNRIDEQPPSVYQSPCGSKETRRALVRQLGSSCAPIKDSRGNTDSCVKGNSKNEKHSRGNLMETRAAEVRDKELNPVETRAAHSASPSQHGISLGAFNAHGNQSASVFPRHEDSRNDVDDLIKQDGAHGNHYQSARGDQKGTQIHGKELMLHQLSPKLSGNKLKETVGFQVFNEDGKASLTTAVGLSPLNNDDLIPLPKLKLMTAQVNAACLMSGINAPLSVRRAPVAAVDYLSALPVIENTSQQEVPSNSMEMKITSDAAVDGNGQELPDPEDDEELLDYGEDDETDAASTENYEEDPADEYIGLRGLLSTDSSVKGDETDAASPKNAVIEKQQDSPEKAQVGVEMPLDVGNASPGLSEGRLSEKELLRAAFYSSRSNNSQLVVKNFEPKPHLAHLVDKLPAQEVNIGEDDELDTESTAQNYVNAAANADLSPEKVAEHKKKLKKYRGRRDKSVPPTVGGRKSARISLSKTSGRQ